MKIGIISAQGSPATAYGRGVRDAGANLACWRAAAAAAICKGNAAGFAVSVVGRVDNTTASDDPQRLAQQGNGSLIGWNIEWTAAGYWFTCGTTFGGGTTESSPKAARSAAGTIDRIVGVFDGTHFRIYVNGIQGGAGTAKSAGALVLDTIDIYNFSLGGAYNGGSPGADFSIMGGSYTETVPDAAAVAAWDASVVASGSAEPLPGATQGWRAEDIVTVGAGWPHNVGATDLTAVGRPVVEIVALNF